MSKSYLLYSGPNVYVEMGECTITPRHGDVVVVDGHEFIVDRVEWDVFTGKGSKMPVPDNYYPQHNATVYLIMKPLAAVRST